MNRYLIIAILALAAFSAPHLVQAAAAPFQPIVPLPGLSAEQYAQLSQSANGFGDYIKLLYKLSIGIGAMLAVLMFVYGGFQYMTSDVIGDKKKGIGHIRDAVIGLLLLISVVIILQAINPCILQINIFSTSPGNCSPQTTQQTATQQTAQQVEDSRQGATYSSDGSCITLAPTACVSGNPPVIKCSNGDNTYSDRPTQGCGSQSEAYICEQSACGSAPVPIPQGAHTYTGHDAECMTNGCTGYTAPQCTNLHEACIFSSGYSDKPSRGCPSNAQPGYICLDGVDTSSAQNQNLPPDASQLSDLPSNPVLVPRGTTCPTDHPNPEAICQYDSKYMGGETCTPASAAKTLCLRTCTGPSDHDFCIAH